MNTTDLPENRIENFGGNFARYALALILIWVGLLKFTAYEAKAIEGLVSNSFLFAWAYQAFGLQMLSNLIGVVEIVTGLLIAARKFSPLASVAGGCGAIVMFCLTMTFVFTTPGVWQPGYGFPFPAPMPGQFLAKDLLFLAVSIWVTGESLRATRHHRVGAHGKYDEHRRPVLAHS